MEDVNEFQFCFFKQKFPEVPKEMYCEWLKMILSDFLKLQCSPKVCVVYIHVIMLCYVFILASLNQ